MEYCTAVLVCFSVFTAEYVVYAQKSADLPAVPEDNPAVFFEQGISIPENASSYFVLREMPYVEEITSLSDRVLPIIDYRDTGKEPTRLFVWSDGTIVWRHKDHDGQGSKEYRFGMIDKKKIESITTEITKKGKQYSSGQNRFLVVNPTSSGNYTIEIMFSDFFYGGHFTSNQINQYIEAKESLKKIDKEERVAFVKRIANHDARIFLSNNFLLQYRQLLPRQDNQRLITDNDVLSDDEINAIAPYLFDDIDFFLFCRDIFLSLIPSEDQGTEVEVKYERRESHETTTPPTGLILRIRNIAIGVSSADDFQSRRLRDPATIVTVYREDGNNRYEYHRGTIGEYLARTELLWKRQAEEREREISMPVQDPECP